MKGLLLLSFAFGPQGDGDRWFGEDKLRHFVASVFVQSVAFSALRLGGADEGPALAGASVATLGVGVAKEVHDARAGSGFSGRDLAWDAAGAATASLWLSATR